MGKHPSHDLDISLVDSEQRTQISHTCTSHLQNCELMGIVLSCEICGNLSHSNRKLIKTIFERGIISATTGSTMCLHMVLPLFLLPSPQIIIQELIISHVMTGSQEWPFHTFYPIKISAHLTMVPDNRRKFRSPSFYLRTFKSLLYHFMIRYGTYSNDLVA